jgi:hypothetical protein
MKVYVNRMIETIRIEGRAKTRTLDVKAFELTGPGLNSEALLLSFGNVGSTYQTRAPFIED